MSQMFIHISFRQKYIPMFHKLTSTLSNTIYLHIFYNHSMTLLAISKISSNFPLVKTIIEIIEKAFQENEDH